MKRPRNYANVRTRTSIVYGALAGERNGGIRTGLLGVNYFGGYGRLKIRRSNGSCTVCVCVCSENASGHATGTTQSLAGGKLSTYIRERSQPPPVGYATYNNNRRTCRAISDRRTRVFGYCCARSLSDRGHNGGDNPTSSGCCFGPPASTRPTRPTAEVVKNVPRSLLGSRSR